jgi:hypothetical protein
MNIEDRMHGFEHDGRGECNDRKSDQGFEIELDSKMLCKTAPKECQQDCLYDMIGERDEQGNGKKYNDKKVIEYFKPIVDKFRSYGNIAHICQRKAAGLF